MPRRSHRDESRRSRPQRFFHRIGGELEVFLAHRLTRFFYATIGKSKDRNLVIGETVRPQTANGLHGGFVVGVESDYPVILVFLLNYLLGSAALMSARADSESRSTARSPIDTMPTGFPSSTTGNRRMAFSRMIRTASPTA